MFTGIIEGLGTICALRTGGDGQRLTVAADFALEGTRIGDSIAVNGACLTVVALDGRRFQADVSPETVARTAFSRSRIGERVNLERALRLSDRIDGHLVSGHIDAAGVLSSRQKKGNAVFIGFQVPPALTRYMIEKGSVAVDGVSLTLNQVSAGGFEVCVIPHTAGLTTVGFKPVGATVNIETDLIGKYVERFMGQRQGDAEAAPTGVDMRLLAKSGFL
ncbi:MAG: riboflavin synthase [Desulfobacteraceae bacterium]|jgi:riboflavin synthase